MCDSRRACEGKARSRTLWWAEETREEPEAATTGRNEAGRKESRRLCPRGEAEAITGAAVLSAREKGGTRLCSAARPPSPPVAPASSDFA